MGRQFRVEFLKPQIPKDKEEEPDEESPDTELIGEIEKFLEESFKKIVGMEDVKAQLREFAKDAIFTRMRAKSLSGSNSYE
jgi:hypothetical protein